MVHLTAEPGTGPDTVPTDFVGCAALLTVFDDMNRLLRSILAVVLTATASTTVIALAAPAQAAACVTTDRPLGAATGYTEFIAGNGSRGSESEGAIAWGGNLNANGMTVGTHLTGTAPTDPTLVVAGTHGSFNLQKGSAYVTPKSGVNFNGGAGTGYLNTNPVDFTTAFGTLTSRSATWGAATPNGTAALGVVGGQNYLVLTGTDPQLNVFSLTPAQLSSGAGIAYNVPAGSTVLVNVAATTATLQGQVWIRHNGNYQQAQDTFVKASWSKILWNFPNATSIQMNVGSAWAGTILAPKANLAINSVGHTIGQIVTAQFSSNYETHLNLFPNGACLPPLEVTPPAENPSLQLTKSASAVTDLDGNGTDAGDQITYSFTVKSTGDVALTNLVVTDPLLGAVTCPSASLAPAASVTCDPKAYTITPADMTAGSRANTATATARSPAGATVSDDDTVTTPLVATRANVRIAKAVDKAAPRVGETVTYTLTATNDGPAAATNVVLTDALPAGITFASASNGCSQASGTVTCTAASIAAGGIRTFTITATVNPVPTGTTAVQHDLDVQKVEAQIDLEAGQTRTVTLDCAEGYTVLDGSPRTDAVDQGTGTLASVLPLASYAADADTWTTTLRNDATGRAQGKVFAVCLRETTSSAAGHAHPIVTSGPVTQTLPAAGSATLTCATGSVPVAPGYQLSTAGTVASQPNGVTGWTFDVGAPGTVSIRCLPTQVGTAAGHQHELDLTQLAQTTTVPAGRTAEYQLTCADDAKGIVAGSQLGAGLVGLGNDPRPKTRAFRFANPTGADATAGVWLLCLKVRTAGASAGGNIVNTASVSTATTETSYGDNSASASFGVDTSPVPVAAPVAAPVVTVAGAKVAAEVRCTPGRSSCVGTARLVASKTQRVNGTLVRKGTVLAKATYRIAAGKKAVVRLTATKAGGKVLRAKAFTKATLTVGNRSRAVTVRR